MSIRIEFFYTRSTGIGPEANQALKEAIEATGAEAEVAYVEVNDSEEASRVRCLGSPTIRVNGVDVEYGEREPEEYSAGTRYYNTPDGWKPYPHARLIANTIVELEHRAGSAQGR
jgi:hypothetical protein